MSNEVTVNDEFDGLSAWDLVVARLSSIFLGANAISTGSETLAKWLAVTEIFLSHGASSELLRSKMPRPPFPVFGCQQ